MTFTWPVAARTTLIAMILGGLAGASCSSPKPENGTNTNWQCATVDDCEKPGVLSNCQTPSCSAGKCTCAVEPSPNDSGVSDAAKPSNEDSGVIDPLPARCREPQIVGQCNAAFPRYWYDSDLRDCRPFIYGGCGGNENNFETQGECEAACNLSTTLVCDHCNAGDAGVCAGHANCPWCKPTTDCPACPSVEGLATAQGTACTDAGVRCIHGTSSCTCIGASGNAVWDCRILPL